MGTNFRFESSVPRARLTPVRPRQLAWVCALVVVVCAGAAWVSHGPTSDARVEPMNVVLQYQPVQRAASVPVYAGLLEQTGDDVRFLLATQRVQQRRYARLADQLSDRGFRIIRVPILHGEPMADGRRGALVTWNNALLDRAGGRAFVPRYGVAVLDERAYGIWRSVGYEVVPIDARAAIVSGGAVRCLTTLLPSREPARRRIRPD